MNTHMAKRLPFPRRPDPPITQASIEAAKRERAEQLAEVLRENPDLYIDKDGFMRLRREADVSH